MGAAHKKGGFKGSQPRSVTNGVPEVMRGDADMSRRFTIVCAMIIFAFSSAAAGCTSTSNPTPTSRIDTAGDQASPQFGGTWSTKASLPAATDSLAAGVVNGILYAVGGSNGAVMFNAVEAYDPSTDSWTTKAP